MLRTQNKNFTNNPREKLIELGAEALNNSELLAVLLQFGTRSESVFSIAKRLDEDYGLGLLSSLRELDCAVEKYGLPRNKALQIIAALELGKRVYGTDPKNVFLNTPEKIFAFAKNMALFEKEYLKGVYLDSRLNIVAEEILAVGSINLVACPAKEVVMPSVRLNTPNLVLIHNHPSGDPTPSKQDVTFTAKVLEACDTLDIKMVDHVIIAKSGSVSFFLEGYMT